MKTNVIKGWVILKMAGIAMMGAQQYMPQEEAPRWKKPRQAKVRKEQRLWEDERLQRSARVQEQRAEAVVKEREKTQFWTMIGGLVAAVALIILWPLITKVAIVGTILLAAAPIAAGCYTAYRMYNIGTVSIDAMKKIGREIKNNVDGVAGAVAEATGRNKEDVYVVVGIVFVLILAMEIYKRYTPSEQELWEQRMREQGGTFVYPFYTK